MTDQPKPDRPDGDGLIPIRDLPLFWEGRARAFRIIDAARLQSNEAALYQAGCYDECAKELRAALATPPSSNGAEGAGEAVVRDTNMFSRLAYEPLAVIPEGYSAPLDIRTAAEIEHDRLARKAAPPQPAPD